MSERKISPSVNEILFRLHVSGVPDLELINMYKGTVNEFSIATLMNAKKYYKWKEREEKIIEEARKISSDAINHSANERLKAMNSLINAISKEVVDQCKEYLSNPSKKPSLMPKNLKDLEIIFKLYDHVLTGGVQQHAIGIGAAPKNFDPQLQDDTRKNLLKLLAESATKELSSMDATPVDFIEIQEKNNNSEPNVSPIDDLRSELEDKKDGTE